MTELITFILFTVISSFIINGWYEVTRYGRVFAFWSEFWQHFTQDYEGSLPKYRFPEWVRNPISECIMCFSSVYGSTIFWLTYYFEGARIFQEYTTIEVIFIWFAYLLCLTVCNYIVHLKFLSK